MPVWLVLGMIAMVGVWRLRQGSPRPGEKPNTIALIKAYRAQTGCSLAEAKAHVEQALAEDSGSQFKKGSSS